MDLSPFRQNFEKDRNRQKYHHTLKEHPTFTKIANYHFSARNTNIYKICQLRKAIFSTFYDISQPNFVILLNIGCSFKLW